MFLVYTTLATQGAGIGSESILDVDELGYLHKVWLFGVKMTNISDPLETHLNWIGSGVLQASLKSLLQLARDTNSVQGSSNRG